MFTGPNFSPHLGPHPDRVPFPEGVDAPLTREDDTSAPSSPNRSVPEVVRHEAGATAISETVEVGEPINRPEPVTEPPADDEPTPTPDTPETSEPERVPDIQAEADDDQPGAPDSNDPGEAAGGDAPQGDDADNGPSGDTLPEEGDKTDADSTTPEGRDYLAEAREIAKNRTWRPGRAPLSDAAVEALTKQIAKELKEHDIATGRIQSEPVTAPETADDSVADPAAPDEPATETAPQEPDYEARARDLIQEEFPDLSPKELQERAAGIAEVLREWDRYGSEIGKLNRQESDQPAASDEPPSDADTPRDIPRYMTIPDELVAEAREFLERHPELAERWGNDPEAFAKFVAKANYQPPEHLQNYEPSDEVKNEAAETGARLAEIDPVREGTEMGHLVAEMGEGDATETGTPEVPTNQNTTTGSALDDLNRIRQRDERLVDQIRTRIDDMPGGTVVPVNPPYESPTVDSADAPEPTTATSYTVEKQSGEAPGSPSEEQPTEAFLNTEDAPRNDPYPSEGKGTKRTDWDEEDKQSSNRKRRTNNGTAEPEDPDE